VAVDGYGNVFIGSITAIQMWTPGIPYAAGLFSLFPSSTTPGVAVDGAGNVYFSEKNQRKYKLYARVTGFDGFGDARIF
jgi:hypothetical protein